MMFVVTLYVHTICALYNILRWKSFETLTFALTSLFYVTCILEINSMTCREEYMQIDSVVT